MTIKVTLTAEQHQGLVAEAQVMTRDQFDWVPGYKTVLSSEPVDMYVYDGQKIIISERH